VVPDVSEEFIVFEMLDCTQDHIPEDLNPSVTSATWVYGF
jgi:hypothetical protein